MTDELEELEELVPIGQAAREWNVGAGTIESLLRAGELEWIQVGRYRRILRSSMVAYIARRLADRSERRPLTAPEEAIPDP